MRDERSARFVPDAKLEEHLVHYLGIAIKLRFLIPGAAPELGWALHHGRA